MPLATHVQNLINRATYLAGGQSIKLIRATLGELTGLTAAEVQAEFKQRRSGTAAANAQLVLHLEPARAVCLSCEQLVPVQAEGQPCGACGSYRRRVVAGQRLSVDGVSVDRSQAATRPAVRPRATAKVGQAASRE